MCRNHPYMNGRNSTIVMPSFAFVSVLSIHLWCAQDQRQPDQQQQQQQAPLEPPLFSVNKNALKGEEEMRRMFGRDVVRMRHQEDEAADLGNRFASHETTSILLRHAQLPKLCSV